MKALGRFLSAAIAAVVITSCTANGGSIYYAIQNVQKVGSSTLPIDLTVADIVNVAGANLSAPYYIAVGSVFNGPLPSNGTINWAKASPPQTGMMCNALTWDGTNLWAGYFAADGSTFGLYHGLPNGSNVTWIQDTSPNTPSGKQILYVTAIGSDIFVCAGPQSGSGPFELDVLNGGAWTNLLSNLPYPVTGVVLYLGTYFITTSSPSAPKVYTLTGGIATPTFTDITSSFPGSPSNEIFQGLFSDPGKVILALASQNLYFSPDGISWAQLSDKPVSGYNAGFLGAAGPVDGAYSNGGVYLVGTDASQGGAAGFYSFNLAARSMSRYINLSISLYVDAIRRVLYDPVNNIAFFGTINSGLWRTSVDASGNPQSWVQE